MIDDRRESVTFTQSLHFLRFSYSHPGRPPGAGSQCSRQLGIAAENWMSEIGARLSSFSNSPHTFNDQVGGCHGPPYTENNTGNRLNRGREPSGRLLRAATRGELEKKEESIQNCRGTRYRTEY
ncbi:hypothetical protein EYF80_040886 [Liparis tanakae]|uniref:Uncharacterized protein n=1 Tax=Liparis tanakae TaxID=230148 RepID=A0A4Z2G7Y4_9TELE|nr:hypothetical protein EYF80_040886 [Liparis tanakae]